MSKIIAKGKLKREPFLKDFYPEFEDEQEITIIGEKYVSEYVCDNFLFRSFVRVCVRNGEGRCANSYYPEPNSMLQAYVFLLMIFDPKDVKIEGEIEDIEYEKGVIY